MMEKKNVLIGCTGSVASILMNQLVTELQGSIENIEIRVVATKHSQHFFDSTSLPVKVYQDEDEWKAWTNRSDPVLHIELRKWADMFLIAPLDANTLAKISNGLCDNLLTTIARAWDLKKCFLFCPAMNTLMWEHPVTSKHINILKQWGYKEIPCIEKTLVCGDTGFGAMAEISTIVKTVKENLEEC
ncbi:phosphopantothenoylcysteine decarboxylase-like isoform X2 [Saccoglossus kowalevskii]|uniref:Phosphopantothenoylcysteine decarboxylase-like n=1 Tax=Saccoglossus kowalevskii TaxID=10224 RepID=A0ABM0GLT1_SACKO|nr:PREDICTED: phosphopantothenoylcysteine decarboxylase-like [Saccoglossus kowalevskii]